jgi:hypothetical protein
MGRRHHTRWRYEWTHGAPSEQNSLCASLLLGRPVFLSSSSSTSPPLPPSSFFFLLPSSSSSSFLFYVFFTYFSSSSSVTYPNNVALVAGEVITELH